MRIKIFYSLVLLFFPVFCPADTGNTSSKYAVCSQPYALCTTAPCKAVPGSTTQSVCSCIVQDGPSLGQTPCEKRKPVVNSQGKLQLTSNFSFSNAATNKILVCKGNYSWTNCLDKPCIVDPQNSNQASCMCDIVKTDTFITFGGQCDTASCGTTLYSGATTEMVDEGSHELEKFLKLTKSPMQNCPLAQ